MAELMIDVRKLILLDWNSLKTILFVKLRHFLKKVSDVVKLFLRPFVKASTESKTVSTERAQIDNILS